MKSSCWISTTIALLCALATSGPASAAGFAAYLSPPRFELKADPGETLRQTITIGNDSVEDASYEIRTADWDLKVDGGVIIHPPELQAASCRPWSRIERRTLALEPNANKRFRFEIAVPEDAPAGECRVALLITGSADSAITAEVGNVRLPVRGRVAAIIYVTIGDAKPDLVVAELGAQDRQGRRVPVARMRNRGTAHGRPEGVLRAVDALGVTHELAVATLPVLPGQETDIPLWPTTRAEVQEPPALVYPIKLSGRIEWDGGSVDLDQTVP